MQPWHTPFMIWNQSVVPCPVLTVASWPAYRFLKRQVRWSGIPISFRIFHSLWWSTQRLWYSQWSRSRCSSGISWFLDDPMDVGNLISGSSAFYKSSLNIWKFSIHILLKPDLENFEHYFASMSDECKCAVVWAFFGIVNKAEVDVSLELSCFSYDQEDVGSLFSGSSAFYKSSLNIWKFMIHVLLKPGLETFEHYFASVWDKYNCAVVWAFIGIAFLWDWKV